ncbi:MAG: hypothetical protein HFI70_09265 [Lachnospiraceae bacterium]|nr:hypothetical protein [Lachnospiraceae bacterium]
MKDAIDKRNDRERIARTIVKRRNIIYTSREELERREQEERNQKMQKERQAAEEVVQRLKEDENKKMAMEIQRLIAEREMLEKQLQTGMDATGKKPMSGVTQERVEAILSEKSKQLQDLIAAHSVENREKVKTVEPAVQKNDEENKTLAEKADSEEAMPIAEADAEEALPDVAEEVQAGPKVMEEFHPEMLESLEEQYEMEEIEEEDGDEDEY